MKPEETLGMIEEAAGTRMYETKKIAALKTIEKKQVRVEELSKCLNEEITPTLDKLREERKGFQTLEANNVELERLDRLCAAIDYKSAETKLQRSQEDKDGMTHRLQELKQIEVDTTNTIKDCNKKIEVLQVQRENAADGELRELASKESEASKGMVKASSALENHRESLKNEKKSMQALAMQSKNAAGAVEKKKVDLVSLEEQVTRVEDEYASVEAAASQAAEKYQNAIAGVADETNSDLLSRRNKWARGRSGLVRRRTFSYEVALKAKHAASALKNSRKKAQAQSTSNTSDIKEQNALQEGYCEHSGEHERSSELVYHKKVNCGPVSRS